MFCFEIFRCYSVLRRTRTFDPGPNHPRNKRIRSPPAFFTSAPSNKDLKQMNDLSDKNSFKRYTER
jgi:hypothetical protein